MTDDRKVEVSVSDGRVWIAVAIVLVWWGLTGKSCSDDPQPNYLQQYIDKCAGVPK